MITQKVAHDEALKRYYECQAVEQALRTQIIEAIDSEYLDVLRNIDTDMINESIPEIFQYLQENYGQVKEEQLVEKEDEVHQYIYDPQLSVDKVFSKITLFQDLCVITNNDHTDNQLVQMAYLIFNRTRAFVDALKKWNSKETSTKTFATFKKHMREEHQALKQVGALTLQDSSFYQANMVQHQDLQARIDEQVKSSLISALADYQEEISKEPPPLVSPQENITGTMNNIIEDNTAKILLQMIKKLSEKIEKLTPQPTQKNINPKTGRPYRRYCHSCGCCDYWGKFCPNKKPGHIDSANFKDRKGGSNRGCLPNKE